MRRVNEQAKELKLLKINSQIQQPSKRDQYLRRELVRNLQTHFNRFILLYNVDNSNNSKGPRYFTLNVASQDFTRGVVTAKVEYTEINE